MSQSFEEYLKEIEDFYLKQKGVFAFLSAKEIDLIKSWYKKNISTNIVKEVIKQEIAKFPIKKKKKFSLILVDSILKEKFSTKKEKKAKDKLQKIIKVFNIPEEKLEKFSNDVEKERFIVFYIWQNINREDKERLIHEATSNIDKTGLSKTEYEEMVKSYIYTKILNYIEFL